MNLQTDIVQMDIIWQYTKEMDGVRILRVHSYQPEVVLPEMIEGKPVTEIGAYCFSASEPKFVGEYFHTNERAGAAIPAACGLFVVKVQLPNTVTIFHNAAFYNCRKLKTLAFGTEIKSIGSDVFTNCRELKNLEVLAGYDKVTGLNVVLERLESDIFVSFIGEKQAKMFFPEYYEWLDEIGPAHIFSRSIEGEGFRMRRAFSNHIFDFAKYDQCFENAIPTETKKALCEMAYLRLTFPVQLSENVKKQYEAILLENLRLLFEMAIKKKDLSKLMFPVKHFSLEAGQLSEAQNLCLEADWAEGSTLLMEEQQKIWKKNPKKFDFDDFD